MKNVKKDCFAISPDFSQCLVLSCSDCSSCKFYKTNEQFFDDLRRTNEILIKKGLLKV